MGKYVHLKDGIVEKNHGDFIIRINRLILKFTLSQAMIILLTYKALDFRAQLSAFMDAVSTKKTSTANSINEKIRYMFKVVVNDVERQINETGDLSLAELMDMEFVNTDKVHNKAEIEVINDVTIGQVLIILLAVYGAHSYNIECTKISENGGEDVIVIRNITNADAMLDGFESGAKYRFRSQAILSNNTLVDYTGAVELRIN